MARVGSSQKEILGGWKMWPEPTVIPKAVGTHRRVSSREQGIGFVFWIEKLNRMDWSRRSAVCWKAIAEVPWINDRA